MLKKAITYENPFTGAKVTEEHYFHISKADLIEMEMEEHKDTYTNKDGEKLTGLQAKLSRIVEAEDGKAIMAQFKDLIRRSFGKKDGDRFIKNDAVWEDFASSEAYSQLMFELCTNADAAGNFVNGIIPGDLDKVAANIRQEVAGSKTARSEPTPLRSADATPTPAMAKAETALAPDTGPVPTPRIPFESTDPPEPRVLTRQEMVEMNGEELQAGLADGRYKLS